MTISHKMDYLTLTLLPAKSNWTINEALEKLLKSLFIDDWLPYFKYVGSGQGYAEILRYNDVSLKIPNQHRWDKQGLCVEFTGNGLDYFVEYLRFNRGLRLRTVLNRFRCLCQFGCKTKCSRLDWAVDQQCFGDEKPLLCLQRIYDTLLAGNFVSKFRKADPSDESCELQSCYKVDAGLIDDKLLFRCIKSQDLSTGKIGMTIYLGKRRSGTYIRFYDKLAEQLAKKGSVPDGCTSWVRYEMEFHRENAAAVLTKYLDLPEDEFQAYICGLSLSYIRFVDRTRSRKYNCVTTKWWLDFLGNAKKASLIHHKVKRNKFLNFMLAFKKQYGATFSRAVQHCPGFLMSVIEGGAHMTSKTADQITADYNAIKGLPPNYYDHVWDQVLKPESGEDYWRSFTDLDELTFSRRLSALYRDVFNREVGASDFAGGI